jgi:glutamate-1-semialdehyde aminotransferase/acyl carrier protein
MNNFSRRQSMSLKLIDIIGQATGIEIAKGQAAVPFVELGFDSLSLTQLAIKVRQEFHVDVTFRQLMESCDSLTQLAALLEAETVTAKETSVSPSLASGTQLPALTGGVAADAALIEKVVHRQLEMMQQQLAMLSGSQVVIDPPQPVVDSVEALSAASQEEGRAGATALSDGVGAENVGAENVGVEGDGSGGRKNVGRDSDKAFGAIARIHTGSQLEITERQRQRLDAFVRLYTERTRASKGYTQTHRPHLADPRVVTGFKPLKKEFTYPIVVKRSRGSRLWDIDDNEYVDALNGFGMSLFGWQPPFVVDAVKKQIDEGYEIGPQHPLAGEVAKMICELTGFDRAGLCNTGSEAVMGALRIARTVTGRNTIVVFTGAYHGIFDEVLVRGGKGLRAFPAAPGIMPSTAQNVLVLEYGTPETLALIKSRASELAAVLVEPVQSRQPELQPREFLRELRAITEDAGTLLIFDEVVTGFRCHPGGIQALFGIRADICTYGKVIGGGFPIGVIAGKREYLDALDGGAWQYGDDSIPRVGVTYFAGTFVRHPLALAAAKATLAHLAREGSELQSQLTNLTSELVGRLNKHCEEVGAPIAVTTFASMWRVNFTQEHPLQDLLFAMMRSRGVHILENFPCFLTTAHSQADIEWITSAFRESVAELQEGGFLPKPRGSSQVAFDAAKPPLPDARLGKDQEGNAAWYVPDPASPGKYLELKARNG